MKPYVEEKGGKLDFVEFRFKVAAELEPLEEWLRSEPREVGPVRKSAAQILEEERKIEEARKDKSQEKGKEKEKEREKEKEKEKEKGSENGKGPDSGRGPGGSLSPDIKRVNIVETNNNSTSTPSSGKRNKGLKGKRSNSSDAIHSEFLSIPPQNNIITYVISFHPLPSTTFFAFLSFLI